MKAYREDSDTPIMDLKGKKVAVVGGGNVAMDAARCSKPVSYTHLLGDENMFLFGLTAEEASHMSRGYDPYLLYTRDPVSYTHLREVRGSGGRAVRRGGRSGRRQR